ncbi:hypothetical protein CJ030_MR3G009471 [Morella rubra]|uniref:GRF-type domain-containing protein n=1 Tax=Morella rubra TaxID=262757 RepID=A0A6A1W3J5_9ROSI|nr:hypothetical protein CJ030_MR3G009471 [Morella rubra]
MSNISSPSLKIRGPYDAKVCSCGLKAPLKASWTNLNPGRRFYGCAKFDGTSKNGHCNYFCWVDPSACLSKIEVGPFLNKKVKELQNEVTSMKRTARTFKIMLGVS